MNKWINIKNYWLEDVSIDIRALTDGYKPYKWQYQKSNRLDENMRKAVIIRDGCKCMELCITDLKPDTCNIKDWIIKPMRRQSKAKTNNVFGIKHRDLIKYSPKNKNSVIGYVSALYPNTNQLNFTAREKQYKKVSARSCQLLWRYNKIYWLDNILGI